MQARGSSAVLKTDLEHMASCTLRSSAASCCTAPLQYLTTPAGGCSPSSGCQSCTRASSSCEQTRSEVLHQHNACWCRSSTWIGSAYFVCRHAAASRWNANDFPVMCPTSATMLSATYCVPSCTRARSPRRPNPAHLPSDTNISQADPVRSV